MLGPITVWAFCIEHFATHFKFKRTPHIFNDNGLIRTFSMVIT
jgi:hypothetical protein